MKGRAAQIAALAEPMLELWQAFMDTADPGHRQIKAWLKMNVLTERILKDNADNLAISPVDYPNFKKWSFAMAQLHRSLAQHYAGEEVTLFSEIPKFRFEQQLLQPSFDMVFQAGELHVSAKNTCQIFLQGLERATGDSKDLHQSQSGNAPAVHKPVKTA